MKARNHLTITRNGVVTWRGRIMGFMHHKPGSYWHFKGTDKAAPCSLSLPTLRQAGSTLAEHMAAHTTKCDKGGGR